MQNYPPTTVFKQGFLHLLLYIWVLEYYEGKFLNCQQFGYEDYEMLSKHLIRKPIRIMEDYCARYCSVCSALSDDAMGPEDLMKNLSRSFFEKATSTEWYRRKEALDKLLNILKAQSRLKDGDYRPLLNHLRKIILTDLCVIVVALAVQCVTAMAKALRKNFGKYAEGMCRILFEKFVEKRQRMAEHLREAVDTILETTKLEYLLATLTRLLTHRNPTVRYEILLFLTRTFPKCNKATLNSPQIEPLYIVLKKLLNDGKVIIREKALAVIGCAMEAGGERVMRRHLRDLNLGSKAKLEFYRQKVWTPSPAADDVSLLSLSSSRRYNQKTLAYPFETIQKDKSISNWEMDFEKPYEKDDKLSFSDIRIQSMFGDEEENIENYDEGQSSYSRFRNEEEGNVRGKTGREKPVMFTRKDIRVLLRLLATVSSREKKRMKSFRLSNLKPKNIFRISSNEKRTKIRDIDTQYSREEINKLTQTSHFTTKSDISLGEKKENCVLECCEKCTKEIFSNAPANSKLCVPLHVCKKVASREEIVEETSLDPSQNTIDDQFGSTLQVRSEITLNKFAMVPYRADKIKPIDGVRATKSSMASGGFANILKCDFSILKKEVSSQTLIVDSAKGRNVQEEVERNKIDEPKPDAAVLQGPKKVLTCDKNTYVKTCNTIRKRKRKHSVSSNRSSVAIMTDSFSTMEVDDQSGGRIEDNPYSVIPLVEKTVPCAQDRATKVRIIRIDQSNP